MSHILMPKQGDLVMMKKLLLSAALCLVSFNGIFASPIINDMGSAQDTYEERECFVCYEELQNEQSIDLCENGHEYHTQCSNGPCPMCRSEVIKNNIFGVTSTPEKESAPRTQESSDPMYDAEKYDVQKYDAEKWDAPKKGTESPRGRRAPSTRQPRSSASTRSRSERPARTAPSTSPRMRPEERQQGQNKQMTLENRLTNAQRSLDRLNDRLARTKAGSKQEANILRSIDRQAKNVEDLKRQLGK